MLKKLYYYDLKWSLKIITIFLGLGLAFAVFGRIFQLLPDSIMFEVLGAICNGTSLSLTISAIFNCVIRAWVRLNLTMYKDESYLTHTIPVSISTHFLSKVLATITVIVISMIFLVLVVFIMYYSKENFEALKSLLNVVSGTMDISVVGFLILVILVILFEVIFIVFSGFFGAVYGNSYNKKRVLKTLVYAFGAYFICSAFSIIIMLLSTLFNEDLYNVVFVNTQDVVNIGLDILKAILSVGLLLYIGYCILLYYLTDRKLKQGINID